MSFSLQKQIFGYSWAKIGPNSSPSFLFVLCFFPKCLLRLGVLHLYALSCVLVFVQAILSW